MKSPIFHRIYDYDKSLLPNRYLAKLEEGVTNIDQAREASGASIGYPGWGIIYHILLSHLDRTKEEIIIETGSNFGCTTIILAQALIDAGCSGRVISIELDDENIRRAQINLEAAGVSSHVELIRGDTRVKLPEVIDNLSDIRFAFLDASHLFDDVLSEFEIVLPKLSDDALVVFDNTYLIAKPNEDQRVNGALNEIKRKYGGNLINFDFVSWFTPGMAIWQKKPSIEKDRVSISE